MVGSVKRALEGDIAHSAKTVDRAGKYNADVDVCGIHIPHADIRVPVAGRVNLRAIMEDGSPDP